MVRHHRRLQGEPRTTTALTAQIRAVARPLHTAADLDPLLERIGDARCVLLGEASHGTHEYYRWRTEISKRLIQEKGFSFLAVEGDWPPCYELNRFVKGFADGGKNPREVLAAFHRWPAWMWDNEEIAALAGWLRQTNTRRDQEHRVGFYGLDVYSLWESLYQVLGYLRRGNGAALEAAHKALRCFEPYGEDAQEYGLATRLVPESCEREVIELLRAMQYQAAGYPGDGREAHFAAQQNALVLKDAEAYYRTMFRSDRESWNVRDRHMAETLQRLLDFHGPGSKAIVWAHNTHVGDARFTDMADEGMVNLGQLARERYARENVVLVGFGCYEGSVVAGEQWDAPVQEMQVPPARADSWEDLLHQAGDDDKLLLLDRSLGEEWRAWRGHRAIGVVYRPALERHGNYVPTVLPERYDAFLYLDRTEALRPLPQRQPDEREVPETYPTGV